MPYCSNCGSEVDPAAVVCVKCGAAVGMRSPVQDAPNFGYALLGFFFPIVGLVLYLVWKDQTPLRAASAGKGALVAVILIGVLYACLIIGSVVSYS